MPVYVIKIAENFSSLFSNWLPSDKTAQKFKGKRMIKTKTFCEANTIANSKKNKIWEEVTEAVNAVGEIARTASTGTPRSRSIKNRIHIFPSNLTVPQKHLHFSALSNQN